MLRFSPKNNDVDMFISCTCMQKGLPPAEILNKIEYGQRMSKPAQCDDRIYELMMQCWEWK